MIIHYVSPQGLSIPSDIWTYVEQRGVEQHSNTGLTDDLVAKADVIYMTRLQKERFTASASISNDYAPQYVSKCLTGNFVHANLIRYCVTPQTLAKAKPTLRVLHPLPRGPEISPEVDSDPRAAYFRQMDNGLAIRMALLKLMLA